MFIIPDYHNSSIYHSFSVYDIDCVRQLGLVALIKNQLFGYSCPNSKL